MQGLHNVEQTEDAKAAKIEQAAVGPTLAESRAWVLLPKGIAGSRAQPIAEPLNQLARRGGRAGKKIRRQELPVGCGGTKTGQREKRLYETGVVQFALLATFVVLRRNHPQTSERIVAALSGADANRIEHVTDEDLPIPDLTCACGGLNRLDNGLRQVVVDYHLDANLGD